MAYKVDIGGQFRGLEQAVRAMSGMGLVVDASHAATLDRIGKETKLAAQARLSAREGGTRERRQPGSFGTDSSKDRFVVFIERDGTSPAAEFGAKKHMVFGHGYPQAKMRRRTAGGWSRKGKLVGPEMEPFKVVRQSKRVADDGLKAISRRLDQMGVPRA